MTGLDAALVQQVLDVAQREREAHIEHHRQTDDLRASPDVPQQAALGHPVKLGRTPVRLKPSSSDSTLATLNDFPLTEPPGDLRVHPGRPDAHALCGQVVLCEMTGAEGIVHIEAGSGAWSLLVPAMPHLPSVRKSGSPGTPTALSTSTRSDDVSAGHPERLRMTPAPLNLTHLDCSQLRQLGEQVVLRRTAVAVQAWRGVNCVMFFLGGNTGASPPQDTWCIPQLHKALVPNYISYPDT